MAVVRVWGTCNGSSIEFIHAADDRWAIQVPASTSLSYLIEVYAEDSAGNIGYVATILLSYDPRLLRMSIEILCVGNAALCNEIFCDLEGGSH